MSVWLHDHTWPEVEAYIDTTPTILLPIGSTEQHGPHLPLGTDAYEALSVAEGVAEELDLLVAPPLWYGDARHHLAYPGTMALRPNTVVSMLRDLYDSLAHHEFKHVLTINGHRRANVPTIKTAMKYAKEANPTVEYAMADLVQVAVSDHKELLNGHPEDGTHGGEFETSFMLAEYPDLVHQDEFVPQTGRPRSPRLTRSSIDKHDTVHVAGNWQSSKEQRDQGHLGHRGDPTLASAENGHELRARIITNIIEFLEDTDAV